MFELHKCLDKFRQKSNSELDIDYFLNVITKYKDSELISKKEIDLIDMIRGCTSAYEWNNIHSIVRNFNDNWKNRNSIYVNIENVLKEEMFKEADVLMQEYVGALKIDSQYISLKVRYFKNSSIVDAIKNRCFDDAYRMFKDKCNTDLIKEFNRYREDALDFIIKDIEREIDKKDFEVAEEIFNKYNDYISEDIYEIAKKKYLEKFKKEMTKELKDIALADNFKDIEKVYKKKYFFIPYEEYLTVKTSLFSMSIETKFNSFNFLEAEVLYKNNNKLMAKDDYKNMRKKYSIIYLENELEKYQFEKSDNFYEQNSSILSNEEYQNFKKRYINKYIDEHIEEYLKCFEFKMADEIYHSNIDSIDPDDYIKLDNKYKTLKKKYLYDYLEKCLQEFEFNKADTVYNDNINLIDNDEYTKIRNEYMSLYEEELIHKDIFKLKKLNEYYKGVKEQTDKHSEIIVNLQQAYKKHKEYFTDNMIEIIKSNKDDIKSYNSKNTILNIDTTKKPQSLFETVFFHTKEYYIGKFVRNIYIIEESENTSVNEQYEIRTTSGEVVIADSKKLVEIGSFIKENYRNHCFNCRAEINANDCILEKCQLCSWYLCPECGACRCEYEKRLAQENQYEY